MTILTFNRGLSAVIGKELHIDLTELRNSLPKTLPWDDSVSKRIDRLASIARTAQLRAVYKVLHTIADSAKQLSTGGSEAILDATNKMLQALIGHLSDLVQNHKNTPLRMAKPLQVLLQQLGQQPSPVLSAELFMPFTPEDVSADRPSALPVEAFAQAITDYRAAYQTGLIKLLKEDDISQYGVLRQSLVSIEPKNPHVGYRIFFEAAIATLDILGKNNELDNLSKWVLSKIDPELNHIIQGATQVNSDVLSSMLHLVARADPETSARVRKLQDQFNLKAYMADVNGIDPAIVEKFTQVLIRSRDVWSQHAASEPARVAKLIAELQSKSALLKNVGFTIVIDALHEVITAIANGSAQVKGDQLSLEGAGALLILEQQLRDGPNLNSAHLSASRLLHLIGKTTDYVITANESLTTTAICHALAAQVQDDLNQLEPRLLDLLNAQRDGEQELRNGLIKISKILGIFGKNNSLSRVFSFFEEHLNASTFSDERTEVATKFTQLTTLVETLKTSDKNALAFAQKWLDNQAKVEAPTENDKFKDTPNDSEMLEIFLEEATGIVADLESWLSQLRSDPSMHNTVVNMRRGYHTLKGSGRMVGLVRFGDLSYLSELLLNEWVSSKKIPSDELLDYLDRSLEAVTQHVENFKNTGHSFVNYDVLEQEALALGGMPLTDAPQQKRGSSVKLSSTEKNVSPSVPPIFTEIFAEPIPPLFTEKPFEDILEEDIPQFVLEPTALDEPILNLDPVFEAQEDARFETPVFEPAGDEAELDKAIETPTELSFDFTLPIEDLAPLKTPEIFLSDDVLAHEEAGVDLYSDTTEDESSPAVHDIFFASDKSLNNPEKSAPGFAFAPEPAPEPFVIPDSTPVVVTPVSVPEPAQKTARLTPENWKKDSEENAAVKSKAPQNLKKKGTTKVVPKKKPTFFEWIMSFFKKK